MGLGRAGGVALTGFLVDCIQPIDYNLMKRTFELILPRRIQYKAILSPEVINPVEKSPCRLPSQGIRDKRV